MKRWRGWPATLISIGLSSIGVAAWSAREHQRREGRSIKRSLHFADTRKRFYA